MWQYLTHSLTHSLLRLTSWWLISVHSERSWLVIWARPTDIPQSSSTCCNHVLVVCSLQQDECQCGRQLTVTMAARQVCSCLQQDECQCGRQLTVTMAARQVCSCIDDKRDQTTNDVCQRWETVDQVTSFSPGLQHLTPCHFMPRIQRSACIWRDWMNHVVIYFTHCPRFEDIQHNRLYKWAVNPELDG